MNPREINSSPDNPVVLQIGMRGVVIICAIQAIVLGLLAYRPFAIFGQRAKTSVAAASGAAASALDAKDAPPWGDLVLKEIEIQRPDEYLETGLKKEMAVGWYFKDTSLTDIRAMLVASGLTPTQTDAVLCQDTISTTGNEVRISPPDDVLIAISPEVRGVLYSELSKNPANYYMANPFHVKQSSLDQLLKERGFSEEVVALFKKLLYPRGNLMFFSDIGLMFRHLPLEKDRTALLKVATSEPTVLAKLKIRPDTDLDKVLAYWGAAPGVRYKDLRPLMESIKRLPEGGNMSVLYLLPPFARNRLYTFPLPPQPGEPNHDCFWSALNYFNETPDDRFGDIAFVGKYVKEKFYQISKPSIHGDVIFVCDAKDSALHAAVYLADDIVFTKNGVGYMQPWVLMRLDDLLSFYSTAGPTHSLVFRSKAQ